MALYVPGTSEQDPSKVIMSLQLVAGTTSTNTTNITTNTTNIATNTTNIATNTTNITALQTAGAGLVNVSGSLAVSLSKFTNSLSGNISLNDITKYFDGPSIAQGTVGTWWVSGTVTVSDTSLAAIYCKLWDGTTVISSAATTVGAGAAVVVALSGFIASPAGNLRISCRDITNATGLIDFNVSGTSKDSTISAFRIA